MSSRTPSASPPQSIPNTPRPIPHTPNQPSSLRQSHHPPPSPERFRNDSIAYSPRSNGIQIDDNGIKPSQDDEAVTQEDREGTRQQGQIEESSEDTAYTALLGNVRQQSYSHGTFSTGRVSEAPCPHSHESGPCTHGTLSPRPGSRRSYGSYASQLSYRDTFGGRKWNGPNGQEEGDEGGVTGAVFGRYGQRVDSWLGTKKGKKASTTSWLAERHGVKNPRLM
jgi:hypothetical protein